MYRLVYLSDAVGDIGAREVSQIVERSRAHNRRLNVTGILLFHEGKFFQEIEGPRASVAAAFGKIRKDPRHTNVQVLEFGPVQGRAFEGWALACDAPEQLPEVLRPAALSIYELMPANAEMRGARPKVRAHIRHFLASFQWLRSREDIRPML